MTEHNDSHEFETTESGRRKSIFELLEDMNVALVPNQEAHMYLFYRDGKPIKLNFGDIPVPGLPSFAMFDWLMDADCNNSAGGPHAPWMDGPDDPKGDE